MKLNVTETGIQIVPENAQDIIYIEQFLELKDEDDYADCKRKNCMNGSSLLYLEIKPN